MREQSPVRPGDLVDGKYRIQTVLGLGGMGVVVRAMHEQLGRPVAIKFLLADLLHKEGVVQRFEREARATARLNNEHIIDVLDVGRLPTGEPFIVMELLEGQDLAKYIVARAARLGIDETIDVMIQICDGVSEAHANGIVHRDLKPQNVFVTTRRDGRRLVKVLDFGISKMAGELGGALTGTSDMLGSPYYMSPEQLLATRDVGPSGDVWALGIIMYELLASVVPFRGETLAQVCMQIIQEQHVPFAKMTGDVPPWLASIVDACLQKDPARRMPSVDALTAALRAGGAGAALQQAAYAATGHAATGPSATGPGVTTGPGATAFMAQSGMNAPVQPGSGGSRGGPVAVPTIVQPSPSVMGTAMQLPHGVSTNVGWGNSSEPGMARPPMNSGKTLYIIGAVAALVMLSVGGFGIHRFVNARPAATAQPPSDVPPPPIVVTPPPTATSAEIPPAIAVPTATATTAMTIDAAATTTKRPPHAVPTATAAATTTAAKPHGTEGDFLPTLRK